MLRRPPNELTGGNDWNRMARTVNLGKLWKRRKPMRSSPRSANRASKATSFATISLFSLAVLIGACAQAPQQPPPSPPKEETRTTQTINPCKGYVGVQDRVIEVQIYPDTNIPPGLDAEPVVEPYIVCVDRSKGETVEWKWVGQTPSVPDFEIAFAKRSPFNDKKYGKKNPKSSKSKTDAFANRPYKYDVIVPGFGRTDPAIIIMR
jgi:hypothetical protein